MMKGCLLIHGFTGSPFEVQPLADYLAEHTEWKVAVPTLPGHGEELELKGILHHEWIECAEEALKDLLDECEEVYLVGFSMGGLIAGYLAARYPVSRLVLLSAAAYYINFEQLLKDIKEIINDSLNGKLKENELFNRYRKKIISTPISSTREFKKIVKLSKSVLGEIDIPTFIAQGEEDGIVPIKSAYYLYDKIGSSRKILRLEPGAKHLICHCDGQMELFDEIFCFLKEKNKGRSLR
ncbi:alpha/beta hydrolase [Falsibacillus pallidus]